VQLTPGMRLRSPVGDTEVVVVRAPGHEATLSCAGVPMVDRDDTAAADGTAVPEGSILLGKRYSDAVSGLEVLCTKPGPGPLVYDGAPLSVNAPKPLPSSD